jgi:hypothetical protein
MGYLILKFKKNHADKLLIRGLFYGLINSVGIYFLTGSPPARG